jgi:serine/threonine protein kinase
LQIVCAIKSFRPKNSIQAKSIPIAFQKERYILRGLSTWKHVHILDFFGSFEFLSESKFGLFGLVLSFAEGGDLNQFLRLPRSPNWLLTGPRCLPFCKVLFVQTRSIVDALKFLHDKTSSAGYIIHRDIKPANILIQNATFKIGDFGSSRMKDEEETSKTEWGLGTPMYAPPEKTIGDSDSYGRALDVWALGLDLPCWRFLFCYCMGSISLQL